MSFILDALKKSEREREQQAQGAQPGMVYRRSHTQPLWMFAVMGLLLLNLGFLLVLWLRSDHQAPAPMITVNNGSAAPATTPVNANSNTASSVANNATGAADLRSLQDETTAKHEPTDETAAVLANATVPDGPKLVKSVNDTVASETIQPGVANSYARDPRSIPTLDSLGGSASLNLPALHLDIHVFSANAAERFVFINMRKYLEGQNLQEGPTVEHITPEGAVLKFHEQRFMLPRE